MPLAGAATENPDQCWSDHDGGDDNHDQIDQMIIINANLIKIVSYIQKMQTIWRDHYFRGIF